MDSNTLALFTALKPGQIIGPSHHRFKLIGTSTQLGYAQLWDAEDQSTRETTPVTLLIFNPEQFADADQVGRLRNAINRSRTLKSNRLLTLFGQFTHKGLLLIATPRMPGVTLSQILSQKRGAKLSQKQQVGMITQIARGLHAAQVGRQFHGTLCPELVFISPGVGVQLLGVGWYQALEPDAKRLNYAPFQRNRELDQGTASVAGDTYALAKLTQSVLGFSLGPKAERPDLFSESQWNALVTLIEQPDQSQIATPLQLIQEIFGEESESEGSTEETPIGKDETSSDSIETLANVSDSSDDKAESVSSKQSGNKGSSIAALKLAGWDRPIWLGVGILIGLMISHLLFTDPIPEPVPITNTTIAEVDPIAEPSEAAAAMITQENAQPESLEPDEESETLQENHLVLFRHELEGSFTGPMMVRIPVGRFMMGDQQSVGDDNEKPVRSVRVDRPFAMSQYEVTFDDYDQFAEATNQPKPDDEGWGRGSRPVINVSWRDAQRYVAWLSDWTGEPYRLPSEAEWEYAARAGTETAYWWGDRLELGLARCDGCEAGAPIRKTARVGRYAPNPWGLYDMNGNVDEWVEDCYDDNYQYAPADQRPFRLGGCTQRSMRGGSWFEIPRLVRSASRYRHPADVSRNSWGFRVALDLDPESQQE